MAKNELVLGMFPDEAAADAAVGALKSWDALSADVRLGAIGVLVADGEGGVKEHKLGARSTRKGAGIGLVLAVVAPPTLLVGIVGGGLLGHFHHQGIGLKAEDRERIETDLREGKAAVGVLVPTDQAGMVSAKLVELGADAAVHDVTDEALAEIAAGVPGAEGQQAAPQTAS